MPSDTKAFMVRISPELHEKVRIYADERGVSMNYVAWQALAHFLGEDIQTTWEVGITSSVNALTDQVEGIDQRVREIEALVDSQRSAY